VRERLASSTERRPGGCDERPSPKRRLPARGSRAVRRATSGSHTSLTLLGRLRQDPTDQPAWAQIVERYGRKICAWSCKGNLQEADGEDVMHMVLVRLARHWGGRRLAHPHALEHHTPWYLTMRLFRQKTLGDWDGVCRRMTDALQPELVSR
jgi:hypothetical protein